MKKQITMTELLKLNDDVNIKLDFYEPSQKEVFTNITTVKEVKKAYNYMTEHRDENLCIFMKDSDAVYINDFFDYYDKNTTDTVWLLTDAEAKTLNDYICENTFDFEMLYNQD